MCRGTEPALPLTRTLLPSPPLARRQWLVHGTRGSWLQRKGAGCRRGRKGCLCRRAGDEQHNTGQIVVDVPKLLLPCPAFPGVSRSWAVLALLPSHTQGVNPSPSRASASSPAPGSSGYGFVLLTLSRSYKINGTFELFTVQFYRTRVSKTGALL